jgi:enoyl-[acyl-carrier protein] reductase II
MRVIRNAYVEDWERRPEEIQRFPEQMMNSARAGVMAALAGATEGIEEERHCMPCGQGAGSIHDILSCKEIIDRTISEAREVLARLAPLAGGAQ